MDLQLILFIGLMAFAGLALSRVKNEIRLALLLLCGILLNLFARLIGFESQILNTAFFYIALVVFSLYIFEYVPKVVSKHIDFERKVAIRFAASAFIAALIAGYLTYILTNESLFFSFIFSLAMFITHIRYSAKKSKITHILNFESIASIAFMFSFVLAIIEIKKLIDGGVYLYLAEKIIISLGIGILSAFILIKFANKKHHHNIISFLTIIAALFASIKEGIPSIALASAALLFGLFQTKRTIHTFDFLKKITNVLDIFILIIAGFLFGRTFDTEFVLLALSVYAIFFFTRFFVMSLFAISLREKIFITLNNPKGTAGALLFVILMLAFPRFENLWGLYFMQILISEIVSFLSHALENPNTL